MLYIGLKLGNGSGPEIDIAVDPVEGTNFVAKNLPGAMTVLAISEKGNLFNAPETYMEKIATGPNYPENLIDLDLSVEENIKRISEVKNTSPEKLTAYVYLRPIFLMN
jgi:fructose-1,6-bisphosphatase II / sedoheptulose-1,7-bisphosphatase